MELGKGVCAIWIKFDYGLTIACPGSLRGEIGEEGMKIWLCGEVSSAPFRVTFSTTTSVSSLLVSRPQKKVLGAYNTGIDNLGGLAEGVTLCGQGTGHSGETDNFLRIVPRNSTLLARFGSMRL